MSLFSTTTRHVPTTNCDMETLYSIETYFPTFLPSQAQLQERPNEKANINSSGPNGLLPEVSCIPLENLSLHQPIPNDWIGSPLEFNNNHGSNYNRSNTNDIYHTSDMNFLFSYNDIGVTATASGSPSSSSTIAEQFQTQQQTKDAEQFRRFSLEETDTLGGLMPFYPTYSRERSSMPNVFEHHHQQQQQHHHHQSNHPEYGQITWRQSTVASEHSKYQPLLQSVPSPLKHHAKKRSLVDQVLDDEYHGMPSVISSFSEPIPTAIQQHPWSIRKRTKSMHGSSKELDQPAASGNLSNYVVPSSSSAASMSMNPRISIGSSSPSMKIDADAVKQQQQQQQQHLDYMVPSEPILKSYEDSVKSSEYVDTSSQALAAMPRRQKLRYDGDHYTPKWVRYTGHLKEGYCDSCQPGKWLQLKNSAYWYHKQFYHGISSVSGKSFMKPLEQRMGKGDIIEGLCHQCHHFVPACNGKKKNNYMLWYRHAHKCHLYDKPKPTSKMIRKLSEDSTSSTTTPIHHHHQNMN